jgi:hypothetical protein
MIPPPGIVVNTDKIAGQTTRRREYSCCKGEKSVTILVWILAVVGALWAIMVCLAGGMKTVPEMSIGEALMAVPLPLVALGLAGWRLYQLVQVKAGTGAIIGNALPALLSVVTLLGVLACYLGQPNRR